MNPNIQVGAETFRRSVPIALGLTALVVFILWATGARTPGSMSNRVVLTAQYSAGHEVPEPPPSRPDCASPYAWRMDSPLIDTVADIRRSAEQSVLMPIEGYAGTTYLAPDGRGVRIPWYVDDEGGHVEQFRWHHISGRLQISEHRTVYAYSARCIDQVPR